MRRSLEHFRRLSDAADRRLCGGAQASPVARGARKRVAAVPGDAARRRSAVASAILVLLLGMAVAALAGCGSDGGVVVSPKASYSASPGLGTVLVVVPDRDFQQVEYGAVVSALGDAGYPMQIANAEGGDSVSSDVHVRADLKIADAAAGDYVGVVLVGGYGTEALYDNAELQALVRDAAAADEVVAAICLAPVILARAGVLEGKRGVVTSEAKQELEDGGCTVEDTAVAVDGRIVTGNGPSAAEEFAAEVVKALRSQD